MIGVIRNDGVFTGVEITHWLIFKGSTLLTLNSICIFQTLSPILLLLVIHPQQRCINKGTDMHPAIELLILWITVNFAHIFDTSLFRFVFRFHLFISATKHPAFWCQEHRSEHCLGANISPPYVWLLFNMGFSVMNSEIIERSKIRMNFYFVYPVWQRNQEQVRVSTNSFSDYFGCFAFLFICFVFNSKRFFSPLISPFSRKNLYQWPSPFSPSYISQKNNDKVY